MIDDAFRAKLAALEVEARKLEESPERRREWTEHVLGFTHRMLDELEERKAWDPEGGAYEELLELGVPSQPTELARALDLVEREVDGPGLQPASGGHLGYIPGGGIYPGALGDLIAAATNRYAGVSYAGPGAVRVENLVLRWLRDELGLPETAHGTLTSGGSIATLVAFVAARDGCGIRAANVERSVVYLTRQSHHCIAKSLAIGGLGEAVHRMVPVDERFRFDVAALERQIAADRAAGLEPFLVVATAGTTDTGALDPLNAIADVCEREKLWFHVDGAYGGAFALVPEMRPAFRGIERADSVVMDPHKGLFLPYGTGAVLVRDAKHILVSHGARGAYLQDAVDLAGEPSPADLSPELTRHFRGLRMWLPLVLHGTDRFRAAIHQKALLARFFWARVQELGFTVGPEPDLSVAMFRWTADGEEHANERTQAILADVLADGRVFLSSTTIDGVYWLRVAILCFRTHTDRVEHLLGVLAESVAGLTARR